MSMFSAPSTPEDIKKAREQHNKAKARVRERFNFVHDGLCGMTDDQVKAISLMMSMILYQDDDKGKVEQVHFYHGMINGILSARSEPGQHLVYPDDIFPHFAAEDDALDGEEEPEEPKDFRTQGAYA